MNGNKLVLSAAFVAATLLAFSARVYSGEKYARDAKTGKVLENDPESERHD